MNHVIIQPLIDPEVSAEASLGGQNATLRFRGSADLRVKDGIQKFLLDVHAAVTGARTSEQPVDEVLVDLRELAFMSSSCIKAFVTWLVRVQALSPEQQYRIHFLSASDSHWQRRSLTALSCVAKKIVRISEG